jgi:hypothetical protein
VSSSGTNTLGYGKTKEAIHEAYAKGMTLLEAAKHYGITYASAYGGARRSGLVFKRHNNRALYGHVKLMVIYESQSGLTMAQIAKKHGFSYSSVRSVCRSCILNIPLARKTK